MNDEITLPNTTLRPKGHVSLELFDAQGEVVEKVEKDNYVNDSILKGASTFGMLGGLGQSTSYNNRRYFRGMILTDNDKVPDPDNDRYIGGNILAHGAINRLGDESFRGNYNTEESVIDLKTGYIKQVYDFATNQANGTFQSIYMGMYNIETQSEYPEGIPVEQNPTYYSDTIEGDSIDFTGSPLYIHFIKGKVHYLAGTTLRIIDKVIPSPVNSSFIWEQDHTEYTLPQSCYGMTYVPNEDRYYFFSTGAEIYSAPAADPENFRLEVLTTDIEGVSMGSPRGIVYHEETDTFLVASTYRNYLQRLSRDFEFLERVVISDGTQPEYLRLSGIDSNVVFFSASTRDMHIYGYNLKTNTPLIMNNGSTSASFEGLAYAEISKDWALVVQRYLRSSTDVYLMPTSKFFSRVLLDSPVVKTAQNTMKITYEYTFDPIVL